MSGCGQRLKKAAGFKRKKGDLQIKDFAIFVFKKERRKQRIQKKVISDQVLLKVSKSGPSLFIVYQDNANNRENKKKLVYFVEFLLRLNQWVCGRVAILSPAIPE